MLILGAIIAGGLIFALILRAVQISSLFNEWDLGYRRGAIKEDWFTYLEMHTSIKQIKNGKRGQQISDSDI